MATMPRRWWVTRTQWWCAVARALLARGAGGNMTGQRWVAAVGLSLVLNSSAGLADPVRSLVEMRQENMIAQHWDLSCGAATLATLLTYQLGDPVTEREVALGMLHGTNPLKVRYRGGFSLLDLQRYAQSRGFEAEGYEQMTLDDLKRMAPLIVTFHYFGFYHFVIFRGVVGDRVVLADPAFGNRWMTIADFEDSWDGNIGFVVTKPGEHLPNRMAPRADDFVASSNEAVRMAIGK
jgi:uncharacterized protein